MAQGAAGENSGQKLCSNCKKELDAGAQSCARCGASTALMVPIPVRTVGEETSTTNHIISRNMFVQVVLAIVTFGIYAIYWYYVTLDELHKANGKEEGAGMWTFLFIIPLVGLFALWHHSHEYARFVDSEGGEFAIFIMWFIFAPLAMLLVQSSLNKAATRTS